MFWPKAPLIDRPIVIYKGFVETGPGQFPIKKNVDWVEELGPVQAKMKYATKWGFLFGNVIAATDILVMHQIKERQAQIARYGPINNNKIVNTIHIFLDFGVSD